MQIAGVILNRVAGDRHRRVASEAVQESTGIPVLGALPRLEHEAIANRHLGLLTPVEHTAAQQAVERVQALIAEHVQVDEVLRIARESQGIGGNSEACCGFWRGVR